jgi:hypothetical protein
MTKETRIKWQQSTTTLLWNIIRKSHLMEKSMKIYILIDGNDYDSEYYNIL